MTRTVLLEADELSDAYALKTLYNYLKFNRFEERNNEKFEKQSKKSQTSQRSTLNADENKGHSKCSNVELVFAKTNEEFSVLEGCKFLEEDISSDDLLIRPHSDILKSSCHDCIDLRIDASILKNCAMFFSSEERLRLRWKYKVESELPVLVVSYAGCDQDNVKTLVKELSELSKICLINYVGQTKEGVIKINEQGILKDYYAMADASVNAKNLTTITNVMHNFIEATEGGPLFMVPPTKEYRAQFGYKQLSKRKLIRNCRSFDDLLNKLTTYLDRPLEEIIEEKREHLGKRARYLMQMRRKYLPEIESLIEKILREKGRTLNSGLILERNNYLLRHPETDWRVCDD